MTNNKKGEFIAIDICPICREPRQIVIDRRCKPIFDTENICTSFYPCDECVKKLKEKDHIILYEITGIDPKNGPQLTGNYADVSLKVFDLSKFNEDQKKFTEAYRIIFCDPKFFKIVKEAIDNGNKEKS